MTAESRLPLTRGWNARSITFLVLSVLGLIGTLVFNVLAVIQQRDFFGDWFGSGPAVDSLGVDLLVVAVAGRRIDRARVTTTRDAARPGLYIVLAGSDRLRIHVPALPRDAPSGVWPRCQLLERIREARGVMVDRRGDEMATAPSRRPAVEERGPAEDHLDPTAVRDQPSLTSSSGAIWLIVGGLLGATAVAVLATMVSLGAPAIAVIGIIAIVVLYVLMMLVRLLVRAGRLRLAAARRRHDLHRRYSTRPPNGDVACTPQHV